MLRFFNTAFPSLSKPPELKEGKYPIPFKEKNTSYLPSHFQLKISHRRKSVAIEIKHNQLLIKAPSWLSKSDIDLFIIKKQDWITKHFFKQQSFANNKMHYDSGSEFLLFGQWIKLVIQYSNKFSQELNVDDKQLTFVVPQNLVDEKAYVKRKFQAFLKQQLIAYVETHKAKLFTHTKLIPNEIDYKIYKRRWGCCFRNGKVVLNPLIVSAPTMVIDCVIIHELCHLTHMNHSKAFWQLNDKLCGKCKESDLWLKQNQTAIMA